MLHSIILSKIIGMLLLNFLWTFKMSVFLSFKNMFFSYDHVKGAFHLRILANVMWMLHLNERSETFKKKCYVIT